MDELHELRKETHKLWGARRRGGINWTDGQTPSG
jgi:hypothetical protein